jgi:trimethylamine--corrinoid protein Co-methyltransferase
MQIQFCAAALARRLGVPFHSVGALTASKVPDAQAAYESALQLQAAVLAGVNFIIHATGCLEGLLTMGYEKTVMDADICGALQAFSKGVDLSVNAQALDAVREVGPGAHFLGCEHTQRNFETAFYRSPLADNKSFEQWSDEGGTWHQDRAAKLWRQMLKDYEKPPMDEAIDEALLAYMAKRREEIGEGG